MSKFGQPDLFIKQAEKEEAEKEKQDNRLAHIKPSVLFPSEP
jgi:hypothetical protein